MRSLAVNHFALVTTLAAASAFPTFAVHAATTAEIDSYPDRPVRLIVPFGTGGTDIIARGIAAQLTLRLGKQVVTENRPGAGGTVGMDYVAKAEPSGYTLLYTS